MLGLPGTSIQQKDEESSLNITTPSYTGSGLELRPSNMSKTVVVIQKPGETTTDFYERLSEGFQVYTPFDLEVSESQQMANMVFVA
jgi:hypothetical protein